MEKLILTILATTTAIIPLWALNFDKTANLGSSDSPHDQKIELQSSTQKGVSQRSEQASSSYGEVPAGELETTPNYHSQLNHNAYGVQTAPEPQAEKAVQADKILSHRDQL